MTFNVQIADKVIGVTPFRPYIRAFMHDYLCDLPPNIDIRITQEDIDHERELAESECLSLRVYPQRLALQRKLATRLLDYDTLLIHGSCIAVDGVGYLFIAPSGTGKSTHARLWRKMLGNRAVMVNDDKPFLQINDDSVTAYGSPWDGKHHLSTNISVPLKAICLLSRSKTNHIEPITAEEAFPTLWEQTYHFFENEREIAKSLHLLKILAEQTALYSLGCNMEPEAALLSYKRMKYKQITNQT